MAKINIVLSQAQTTALQTQLTMVPKQTKTVEAIAIKVREAQARQAEAKNVTITLSGAQGVALGKTLGTLPKQTKTVEALASKVTEALAVLDDQQA